MWTNPHNGHCLDFVGNTTDIEEEVMNCVFIHKCALTQPGQHYLCPCTGNGCRTFLYDYCGSNNDPLFSYPVGRILTPFVETAYESYSHDFDTNQWPDIVKFTRSIKCNYEIRIVPSAADKIDYEDIMSYYAPATAWHPFETTFCMTYYYYDTLNVLSYGSCWNDSYPNQAKHCDKDRPIGCISKYQVKDGLYDCPE
ncbi:unnamed protein product, partial [Rotaria sp. Silwood2]